jgi:hypothetical protein
MADKSAKNDDAAKAGDGQKKPLNKQTAKVVQDGVELSWDMQSEGDPDPEAAAKFYAKSVEALQKFKTIDPRIAPELRKIKKDKEDFRKALANQSQGVLVGLILAVLLGAVGRCDVSPRNSSRHYNHDW